VRLLATPTAGYVWSVRSPLASGLTLAGQTSEAQNPAGRAAGMVGGNDWSVFTFEVTSLTAQPLAFVYGRPWELEAGSEPTRTFAIQTLAAAD
jgi:predicted secreted protein